MPSRDCKFDVGDVDYGKVEGGIKYVRRKEWNNART